MQPILSEVVPLLALLIAVAYCAWLRRRLSRAELEIEDLECLLDEVCHPADRGGLIVRRRRD